jgi:hypothetical protein
MAASTTLNARAGGLALLAGALLQLLASLLGALAAPWAYATWLFFVFGALCLCQELGASRPLNRAGLVLLGSALCARTVMTVIPEPIVKVRAELSFALALMAAILFWSVALMHRSSRPRIVGLFGTLLSGSTLLLLLAAHIFLGGVAFLGFAEIFRALADPNMDIYRPMIVLTAIGCLWSCAIALLLWTRNVSAA